MFRVCVVFFPPQIKNKTLASNDLCRAVVIFIPAASTSAGNLLKMQFLGLHARITESDVLEWGSAIYALTRLPRVSNTL